MRLQCVDREIFALAVPALGALAAEALYGDAWTTSGSAWPTCSPRAAFHDTIAPYAGLR